MSNVPTTEDLLEELKLLIKGLDASSVGFWSGGGGGALLEPFYWKRAEKGICNFVNLMTDLKVLRQSTIEEYIRDLEDEFIHALGQPGIIEDCNALIDILETELYEFEVYEISNSYYTSVKIGVGLTDNNQWLGISPLLNEDEKMSFGKDLVRIFENIKQEDFDLKQRTKKVLKKSELPIKASYWSIRSIGNIVELARSKETLIELLLQKANAIKVFYFNYFFDEDLEKGKEEQYIELNIFIQKHLKNMKLYEIGISESIDIYMIGETPQGDWLGISTETSYRY